jgi:hypothetical protein
MADVGDVESVLDAGDPIGGNGDAGDPRDRIARVSREADARVLADQAVRAVAAHEIACAHLRCTVVASDCGHDVGVVLRETDDFVSAVHPGAMLGRPALEQLLEAALRDRQDVQRIPRPDAEPEHERAELELRR